MHPKIGTLIESISNAGSPHRAWIQLREAWSFPKTFVRTFPEPSKSPGL